MFFEGQNSINWARKYILKNPSEQTFKILLSTRTFGVYKKKNKKMTNQFAISQSMEKSWISAIIKQLEVEIWHFFCF